MIGRLLAVDWGDKRIGLAVSDELGMLASPAGTIVRRAGKRPPLAELIRQAVSLGVTEYILGLPLDEQGVDTARCEFGKAHDPMLIKQRESGLALAGRNDCWHVMKRRLLSLDTCVS